MGWLMQFWWQLTHLLRYGRFHSDLSNEMREHLAEKIEELMAGGMPAKEARLEAQREFGNALLMREKSRDVWGFRWLGTLLQDLRYGIRQLRRNPGFTAVAIITLALGIGANTAIFSIIDGVFLRPLPYPQPNRFVYALSVWNGESEDAVGAADYLFWKEHTRVFQSAGAYEPVSGSNLVVHDQAYYVHVTQVSPSLFGTLGVHPILGRGFTQEEGEPDGPRAIVLSYNLWQSLYHAGLHSIGKAVGMNGHSYVVVGVMPRSFQFVAAADVYTPLRLTFHANLHDDNYGMVARLRPGITLQQAQAEVNRVFQLFERTYPEAVSNGWQGLRLIFYRQELTGGVRMPLFVLFGAVSFVLLIAIANLTSLFLGRAASRQREMALRAAIGASSWRLLRQLLAEAVVLAGIGGVLGLLMARWALAWLLDLIPQTISIDLSTSLLPLSGQIKLDSGVLEFTLMISLVAGVAAGLFPFLQTRSANVVEDLKQSARNAALNLRQPRMRRLLVTAEIAIAMVLLAGAGLLTRSFLELRGVNPGFNPQGLWALETALPPGEYSTTAQAWVLQRKVLQNLRSMPGVTGVATTSNLPVERGLNYPEAIPGCGRPTVQLRAISAGYFRVMGIPLLAGREFLDTDQKSAAIINRELAERCWPGHNAVGEMVGKSQVLGVVGDAKEGPLDSPARPAVYVPQWSISDNFTRAVHGWFLTAWVIRSKTPLNLKAVAQGLDAADPTLPVAHFGPMTKLIAGSFAVSKSRLLAVLLDGFTGLALLLAAIGIYGVLAYLVSQRAHEIGIRLALGAQKSDVMSMVLGEGLRLALVGLVTGLAGALALTRLLSSLLYDVKHTDLLTFVAVSLILAGVALLGCYIPALRAANVDPMVALRHE